MHWSDAERPLLVVVGPTAAGKTDKAIWLAQHLGGEIVSADSRYFYRYMDIGTAKPSLAERQGVPHHLIDVTTPDQPWSLSIFKAAAADCIADIHQRGRLPILVGGTGQYIHAVVQDWQIPEQEPDERLRMVLEKWGHEIGALALYEKLARLDPEAAQVIEYKNMRRTIRALEVVLSTGRKFSEQRRQNEISPYSVLTIGLLRPRPELYARIDQRIDWMLANGLVAEVQGLLAYGYSRKLPAMSAIGYREISAALEGEISMEEAVMLIRRQTRVFVRRQSNWFKASDPNIHWFHFQAGDDERMLALTQDGSQYNKNTTFVD
jgi:tRNA dimethylallyltransferase